MQKETFQTLVERYLNGEASAEDRRLLEAHYTRLAKKATGSFPAGADERLQQKIWDDLQARIALQGFYPEPKQPKARFRYMVAAALFIAAIVTGGVVLKTGQKGSDSHQALAKPDIQPGTNGAVLVAADGRKYVFDATDEKLSAQGGKLKLIGKSGETYIGSNAIGTNTFSTPRARQFDLVLPDGSHAWLNAESSISYPTVFASNERKITVTGEVYLEVKHDAKRPFRVEAGAHLIEDLGTSFNISAYAGKPVATTLVEGKIRIGEVELRPGEQYSQQRLKKIDVDEVLAWRKGLFAFGENTGLEAMMDAIGRWYDVEVKYEGKIPKRDFAGKIERNLPLSQVLKILEQQKVAFEVTDRTILVKE